MKITNYGNWLEKVLNSSIFLIVAYIIIQFSIHK